MGDSVTPAGNDARGAAAAGTKLDLIIGATAIARFLGLAPRTVYHLAEKFEVTRTGLPIAREPGFGLVASRTRLKAYLEERVGAVDEVEAGS